MAHNSYARLTVNGVALTGDVTVSQIGGVDVSSDHIEVMRLSFGVQAAVDVATGRSRGRRQYGPLRFVKRIDRTTPLLYRALSLNERVEGRLLLFDNDPADGTTRQFFTVRIANAALAGIESISPDTRDAAVVPWAGYEEVTLNFGQITFTDEANGTEFEDDIGAMR